MKDKTILYKCTHGMYIVTTKNAGCFVDAVSQVGGGDSPLISVAVMKSNNTNIAMHENNKFAISIFGMNSDKELIKTYGFNSMRNYNKFEKSETIDIDGMKIIKDSIGYMILEKVDTIENDTHSIFIGKVIEGDKFNEDEPMTYGYYQEHKEDLVKTKTENGKTAWVCTVCGYVYYGETLPDDFKCPICGVGKEFFNQIN